MNTTYTTVEQAIQAARESLEYYLEDMSAIFEISGGSINYDFNEDGDYEINLDFGNLSDEVSTLQVIADGSFLHAESMGELKIELDNLYNLMNVFHYGIVLTNLSVTASKHNLEISSWTNFCLEVEKYESMQMNGMVASPEQEERFNNYLDVITEVGEQTSGEKFTRVVEELFV